MPYATVCVRCAANVPTSTPIMPTFRWMCACGRGAPRSRSTCRANRCTTVPISRPTTVLTPRCRARSRPDFWRWQVGAPAEAAARRWSIRRAATASWWWRRHLPRATWLRALRASAGVSSAGCLRILTSGTSSSTRRTSGSNAASRRPRRRARSTAPRRHRPIRRMCASRARPRRLRP